MTKEEVKQGIKKTSEAMTARRIRALRKREGCVFCLMGARTDRQRLALRHHDLTYERTELGDYLICAWHKALLEKDWMGDADDRREMLGEFLIRHRPPRY